MIETQIKYEYWLREVAKESPLAATVFEETIEALREVVRATSRYGLTEDYGERQHLEEDIWDKLNALPDWITE